MWTEELWPLVIQLYQKKPTGIKPLYSRDSVKLAMQLHIPPQTLYQKMFCLRQPSLPSLQLLVKKYAHSPKKLEQACRQLRQTDGMGNATEFYDDVKVNETWELDFKPVNARTAQMMGRPLLTPVMLTLILDLYFRLIPTTMVPETPDVIELARLLSISPADVVDVLGIYQYCDPYISHTDSLIDPLLPPCHAIWQRYANNDPMVLSNLANQLVAYFK